MSEGKPDDNLLIRRLSRIAALPERERDAVRQVFMVVRKIPAKQCIVREGAVTTQCCLILSGFAFRHTIASQGRQILAFLVPGDIPDLQSIHLKPLDHDFSALTDVTAAFIPHEALRNLNDRYPVISRALWRETLIEAAVSREWVVSVGKRDALCRTAHLLCEWFLRLGAVGLVSDRSMPLPMTQGDLADALGLSTVHLNRVLQTLRARKLIALHRRRCTILAWDDLMREGDFNPAYLHLSPDPV